MSLNECLNNIILERTIEYNTNQPQNSTAEESNATSEFEAHGKKDQSPHGLLTCSHVRHKLSPTSLLGVTIVNNYAVTCPCKNYAGWPFWCPYRNVGFAEHNLTQGNQLCSHRPKLGLHSTSSNAIIILQVYRRKSYVFTFHFELRYKSV